MSAVFSPLKSPADVVTLDAPAALRECRMACKRVVIFQEDRLS
jgi:hypothetical protein